MASAPVLADLRASAARVLACCALSAFCLVIDDISSRLDEVSSRPAACSVAPSASDCEAAETCPEAAATCSELAVIDWMMRLIGLTMLSVIITAIAMPNERQTRKRTLLIVLIFAAVFRMSWSAPAIRLPEFSASFWAISAVFRMPS